MNKARPSGFITTSQQLTAEQTSRLRAAWESVSTGATQGMTPIFSNDMKFVSMQSDSAVDMQLVQLLGKTELDICRVYRIPPELVGIITGQTPRPVEELNRLFLSQSLGHILEIFEQGLSQLLNLKMPDAWCEFDTSHLLRTDPRTKWEAYAIALRSGALTINDVRAAEFYAPVRGGSEPLVQQQQLPLSLAEEFTTTTMQRMRAETSRNNPPISVDSNNSPKKMIKLEVRDVTSSIRELMDDAGIPRSDSKPKTPEANALLEKCMNRARRVMVGLDNGDEYE
jgi:hypothetical protein